MLNELHLRDNMRPLEQNVVDNVPTGTFQKKEGEEEASCSICLCDFEEGDKQAILPCLHKFHFDCFK